MITSALIVIILADIVLKWIKGAHRNCFSVSLEGSDFLFSSKLHGGLCPQLEKAKNCLPN